jgi:hypothetical protein
MRTTCWRGLLVGPALIVLGAACADRGEEEIELGVDTLTVETDEDLDQVGEAVDEAVDRTGRAVGEAMEETGRAIERAGAEVREDSDEEAGADSL